VVVFGGNRGNNTVMKRGTTAAAEIAMGGRRVTKRANRGCNASCHVTLHAFMNPAWPLSGA
jgi:hypothetical protein